MKSRISVTIDDKLVQELKRYGRREHLSRSQIIEMALVDFLRLNSGTEDGIVVSEGQFEGGFSREKTYARFSGIEGITAIHPEFRI